MRTILTTVGTSLLTNSARILAPETPTDEQIAHYLRTADPEKASAETNSLSRILQDGDQIIFLHSDTEEGARCAQLLKNHYEQKGYRTEMRLVPDLKYTERRFQQRGLRSLVNILAEQIAKAQKGGKAVLINATGGFKAEIAYATLIGLLFKVPVYYIHEAFRDIIQMPATPIGWDFSLIANHEEFFEWLEADLRTQQAVDDRLKGIVPDREQITMLLTEEDGYVMLSPMGEAFYQAYRIKIEQSPIEKVYLSPQASETYREAEQSVRQEFKRVFHQLANPELRRSQSEPKINTDCLVYPQGHRDERVFYYEEGDRVYVCELARHSDQSYERLLARGVRKSQYARSKFIRLTEVIANG